MDYPLTLVPVLERAGKLFGKVEIVSRRPDRSVVRRTYAEFHRRAKRLAWALTDAGLRRGDRVATLMWNHSAHLEAYFGAPAAGGVLHTLNLRLHPDELAAIVNHAGDRFLLVDDVLLPVFESFRSHVSLERVIVVPFGSGSVPTGMTNYEDWITQSSDDFTYPTLDENEAAAMCFTSGTTGRAKGVVYSHRALTLHSLALAAADAFGISQRDAALPVCPMFHANGWGVPYTAVMMGAKLVFPGPHVNPSSLLELIQNEEVTVAFGVPTVWIGVAAKLEQWPGKWKRSRRLRVNCGGAAPAIELIRALERHGVDLTHVFGMTEAAPHLTACGLRSYMDGWPQEAKDRVRARQGYAAPFVEMRVMRPEGEAPWDGRTPGELEVRGPWIASSYYQSPAEAPDESRWTQDGWLRTGDVAFMDEDGYVQIVDRSKDLIKSGGEWISSVDLENALMGHPAVREAAVIAVPHPKLQERPLAVVVLREGQRAEPDELREFLALRFAQWQLPDEFVFVDEIPRTSVGKFQKSALRARYANRGGD